MNSERSGVLGNFLFENVLGDERKLMVPPSFNTTHLLQVENVSPPSNLKVIVFLFKIFIVKYCMTVTYSYYNDFLTTNKMEIFKSTTTLKRM